MEPRINIICLGVRDLQAAYEFYCTGLGFPAQTKPEEGIVFIDMGTTRLSLYPLDKLAEDVSETQPHERGPFPGITLAQCVRTQEEVDRYLADAERAGGKIEKPGQPTFWGGYSGYFTDPDGYFWEVAYWDGWEFAEDGRLV